MISDTQNYVSFRHPKAAELLTRHFRAWRSPDSERKNHVRELVFFCIGTTRVPGDSLGPLVGDRLLRCTDFLKEKSIYIAGNASEPIHALNLTERYALTQREHPDALIIAVDAGLGPRKQVGTFAMWEGSLLPGIALNKDLPAVGNFGLAGIVGVGGPEGFLSLENASSRMVKKMADRISHAICQI